MEHTKYAYRIDLPVDFDTVLEKTVDALSHEGFGVLTEIDVRQTLKKKLDVDFRRYRILGACNPPLAHKALLAEDDIGLLLPCNVVVAEIDDNVTRVAAIDPLAAMTVADNNAVEPIASDVTEKLKRVITAIEKSVKQSK
jgi:uncharacterized protein (DUF302 family)